MSIYVNNKKIQNIFILPPPPENYSINVTSKKVKSVWVDKNGVATKVFSSDGNNTDWSKITWANGTDEEIAAMLDAHYNGEINIHDYWHVGDERVIIVPPIPTNTLGNSMNRIEKESNAKLILLNAGGKTLVNPINRIDECAFVVGLHKLHKDVYNDYFIDGQIYGEDKNVTVNTFNFVDSDRRKWLNTEFKDTMPLKTIFKYHKNLNGANQRSTTYVTSNDYFSLPSEKEVFGTILKSSSYIGNYEIQFEYYKQKENRPIDCFLRSIYYSNTTSNLLSVYIDKNGSASVESIYSYQAFYPFGCI